MVHSDNDPTDPRENGTDSRNIAGRRKTIVKKYEFLRYSERKS